MIDEEFTLMHKALISRAKTYRSNKALLARFTTKYNESLVNGNLTSEQVLAAEQCKTSLSSMVEAERNSLVAINKALSTYYIESLKQNSLEFLSEDTPKVKSTTNSKPSPYILRVTDESIYDMYVDAKTFHERIAEVTNSLKYKTSVNIIFKSGRDRKWKSAIKKFATYNSKYFVVQDKCLYYSPISLY